MAGLAAALAVAVSVLLGGQPVGAAFTAPPAPQRRAYVQGDSVMVGALTDVTSTLRADGWAGTVTGFTGLHTYAAIPLFRQVRSTMGSVAVIELGANDCCDGGSFGRVIDQVMQTLSGLHVIWLTIPVFKPGVAAMNESLWAASRRWPNLTVADWAGALAAHPGYEYPDQVHLKPEGSALLATFIRQQLDAWFDGPDRTYAATFGGAPPLGGGGWLPPNGTVIGAVADGDGQGLWVADSGGGVYSLGDAGFYGSAAGRRLSAPVVGMAATPDGHGYWLVGADGGVFSFGDAGFYGSAGAQPLAAPVVGITPTPTGHGYWLVGSDGGVFSFGDAPFHGAGQDQVGPDRVKASYAAVVPAPSGGYWLVGQAPALAYAPVPVAPALAALPSPGRPPGQPPGPAAARRESRVVDSAPGPSGRARHVGLSVGLGSILILGALIVTLLRDRQRRWARSGG